MTTEYLRCVRSFLCVVCVGTALSLAGPAAAAEGAAGNGSSDLGSIECGATNGMGASLP